MKFLYAMALFIFLFKYLPPAAEWVMDKLGIPSLEEMEDDE